MTFTLSSSMLGNLIFYGSDIGNRGGHIHYVNLFAVPNSGLHSTDFVCDVGMRVCQLDLT